MSQSPAERLAEKQQRLDEARNSGAGAGEVALAAHDLAGQLLEWMRLREALTVSTEALELYTGLVKENAGQYLGRYALALCSCAFAATLTGAHDDGVNMARESVRIHRALLDVDADNGRIGLATALNHFGYLVAIRNRNGALAGQPAEDREEGLAAAEQAVDLYRELGRSAHLAVGLRDLAVVRLESGQEKPSADAAEEAVDVFRTLGEDELSGLAAALVVASECQYRAMRSRQATESAREAVDLWRGLVAVDATHGEPGLALALRALANAEAATGGGPDLAVALAEEAAAIHDRLFDLLPTAYREERFLSQALLRDMQFFRDSAGADR